MTADFVTRLCAIARRQPDAIAVEQAGQPVMTYRALVRQASRVGAAIAARGLGRDDVVGLAIDKSPGWIAGMLGAWWAGAAWMPLDSSQPAQRRRAAIERSGCRLAVVSARGDDALTLDSMALEEVGDAEAPPAECAPASLAYVIFTSGTSGAPKGVAVDHRGLVPMLDQQIEAFGLEPRSRSLWMLSPSFDASVSDVGTALLAGATLCLEDADRWRRTDGLLQVLEERSISYVDMPPAVLATLEPERAPPCLDTVVVGGEVCDADTARRWARCVNLINVYGPTEATVCTSLVRCTSRWSRPLLGRPLAGVRYRVVDSGGLDVADGAAGELWIGGRQLARGYLGDPEMTARRFATDDRGQRWYRTGDRVVRRGDDCEFVGRLDRQCKVRGMLVAPEEVEAALASHPGVDAVAVASRVLAPGRRRGLVAFVEGTASAEELRSHARLRVPHWMVPVRVQRVERLPRTPSGKVDMRAVSKLRCTEHRPRGRAPTGASERRVARWFCAVLGVDAVGADDDFFALGGDSLAVVEVLAAAAVDGVALGPQALADSPTVAALAKQLAVSDLGEERSVDQLRREVRQLSLALPRPADAPRAAPWRHVLVTGATGFLGRRVVAELVRTTAARVTCLVHPRDETARARLRRHCPAAGEAPERVAAVPGDIAAPGFGLPPDDWAGLADSVDAVVHLAAVVNLAWPYRELRAANVLAVRTALELAAAGRPKVLHYASTLSVFVSTDRNAGVAREDDDLSETRRVYGGYGQSKWVAEALVADCLWPASSYRLGLLVGDRTRPSLPRSHWLSMIIRGLANLGCAPRDVDPALAFDATPADDAARALVHLAARAEPAVYHLAGARPVSMVRLLAAMRRAGIALAAVNDDEWTERVRRAGAEAAAVRLGFPDRPYAAGDRHNHRALDLCQATGIRFDCSRARAAGGAIEAVDDDWLARCVHEALGEDA